MNIVLITVTSPTSPNTTIPATIITNPSRRHIQKGGVDKLSAGKRGLLP